MTNPKDVASFSVIRGHQQNLFKMEEGAIYIVLVIITKATNEKSISVCRFRSQHVTEKKEKKTTFNSSFNQIR